MNLEVTQKLGSQTPIPSLRLKGWLFMQSWISRNPNTQIHPLRWTNISKACCCAQEYSGKEFSTCLI